MARYRESDYSLDTALWNINISFLHQFQEELKTYGFNSSMNHVDFMFGSADMNIKGIKHDGEEVSLFENGNFVI